MVSKLRTVYRSDGILIGASPELFGLKSGHGDKDGGNGVVKYGKIFRSAF